MAISHPAPPARPRQGQAGGHITVPIAPFREWARAWMERHGVTQTQVARILGRDEAMIRRWFLQDDAGDYVHEWISERQVERVGIELDRNPRLAPELYPFLAEPVCQRCGAERGCAHLTGRRR